MEHLRHSGLRDRLLSTLVDSRMAHDRGYAPAVLVAVHDPLILLEWPGDGKGLVLVDGSGLGDEDLQAHVERVIAAHDQGLLFIAVTEGGANAKDILLAADRAARAPGRLGLYLVDAKHGAKRVVGRRLRELEKAVRALPDVPPMSSQDLAVIIARGVRERQEAVDFVHRISRRIPHLTLALIALCVVLYLILSGGDARAARLQRLFENTNAGLLAGEAWRLITYAFLHDHRSPAHLIVNMVSLFSLGGFLEPILGKRRLGLVYFATAFLGGLTSALVGHTASVGASGAVWGLLGATLGLLHGQQGFFPGLIARGMRRRLGIALMLNIGLSFLPGIDFACHLGGVVAGYALGRLGILGKRPVATPVEST